MKKLMKIMVLALCCVMLCGVTCNAAKKKKVNAKTSFAVISDAKFNKKKLKKNDVFEYSFKISLRNTFNYKTEKLEEGPFNRKARYYYVQINWKSSKKQEVTQTFKWKSSKKTKTIKGKIPVYPGMQTGKWQLDSILIMDYDPDNNDDIYGSILYINDGTKKQQKKSDKNGCAYSNLSFGDFKVKGKRKADKEAPTFDKETLSLSKTEAETGEKVTFSVKAEDASGVQDITCRWEMTVEQNITDDIWYNMKYNKKTKCYECKISLGKYHDVARLSSIYIQDIYGNWKSYTDWCYSDCQGDTKSEFHDSFSRVVLYRKK